MHSLKKTNAFKIVYENGRKVVNPFFVVYVRLNCLNINRLGISVSKKVGNAVTRNRIKRIIREYCRLKSEIIVNGFDIVIVVRPVVSELPGDELFQKVNTSLNTLFQRHGLLVE